MKVLLLNSHYRGGGAERTARELTSALNDRGVTTELLVGAKDPSYPPGVRGIRICWEKYLRAIRWFNVDVDWRHFGSRLELGRISPGDFDIVHIHNLFGGWISLSAVQRLSERIPTVWTFHDEWPITLCGSYDLSRVMEPQEVDRRWGHLGVFHSEHPKSRQMTRFVEPRLPKPSAIICPSQWLANLCSQSGRYPETPIYRVIHGMEFMNLPQALEPRRQAREALGIKGDAKVILIIAAYLSSVYKGSTFGIDAIKQIKTPNVHVLVAGTAGDFGRELAKSAQLPFTYVGYISDESRLAQMYRAADITLMPSTGETLGYVALESFACETPVVAFAVGGLQELIGENERGLLAKPLDSTLLAAAIDRMLSDDSLRLSCGIKARQWTLENCQVSQWVDTHLNIYAKAIDRFRAGKPSVMDRVA